MVRSIVLFFLLTSSVNSTNVVASKEDAKVSSQNNGRRYSLRRRTLNLVQEPVAETRIIGGYDADIGEYPFFVSWSGCAASLVAPDILLSAAHCQGIQEATVFVGRSRRGTGGIERTVTQRVPHPKYRGNGNIEYDYLLLKLNQPVTTIQPILLNNNNNLPRNNQELTVIGFGRTNPEGGHPPTQALQEVNVNYIPTSSCNGPDYGYNGGVKDGTMFCARANGKDSCMGDSGGPIFTRNGNGSFTQMGIVSWGIGCAEARHPGVYSRVSGEINWIQSAICDMTSQNLDYCRTPQVSSNTATKSPTPLPTRPPTSLPTRQPTSPPTMPPTLRPVTPSPTRYPTPSPTTSPTRHSNGELQELGSSGEQIQIRLEITYDEYSEETGWYFQQGGIIVAETPTGSILTGEGTVEEIIQVTAGQAVLFTIMDTYGDGSGGYKIYGSQDQLLASSDGQFGSGETKDFTVSSSDDDGDSVLLSQVLLNLPGPEPTPTPGGNDNFLCEVLGICW